MWLKFVTPILWANTSTQLENKMTQFAISMTLIFYAGGRDLKSKKATSDFLHYFIQKAIKCEALS
jgi:hypothetical protein